MARQYRTSLVISGDATGGIRAVRATESELRKLESANARSARVADSASRQMTASYNNVARTVSRTSAAVAALGAGAVAASTIRSYAEFDRGLIGVSKTTDIVGDELDALGRDIQNLAQQVPVATSELLEIAQSAGQLGVRGRDNILRFTETVGQLGTATDLAGEEAAQTFARLLTVTGEPIENVDRLGASVVQLGNNFAATESEIAKASQRVAQTTSQYDAGAANVVGIGTALAATGVQAEEGGTQIGMAFQSINDALRNGGQQMERLEAITGQTGDALREKFFNGQSAQVFQAFVEGLGRIQAGGGDVSAALADMDLNGTGAVRVLGTMATRSDVLADALNQANLGFEKNVALNQEAARASESFSAQMQFVQNAADQAAAELGKVVAPGLISGMGTARDVAIGLADNMETVTNVAGLAAAAVGARLVSALGSATAAKIANRRATIAQLAADRNAAAQTLRYAAAEDSAAASALNLAKAEYQAARGTSAEALALQNLRAKQVAAIETRGAYNASLAASTTATRAYASATGVAATAARGLSSAMALLGGPAGVIILAATAAYQFREELFGIADPAEEVKTRVDELTASIDDNSRAALNNGLVQLQNDLEKTRKAYAEARAEAERAETAFQNSARARNSQFQISAGSQAARGEAENLRQEVEAQRQAIEQIKARRDELQAQLNGRDTPGGSDGNAGGASGGGDQGTAALLNEYDKTTVKLNELRAAREKLTTAMQSASPDNISRYRAALANIEDQIKRIQSGTEKAGRTTRKTMTDAERAAQQLDQTYSQVEASLSEQIALHGDTGDAARLRYRLEQGDLRSLSAARRDNLISMQSELDALNRQRDAVSALVPEFQRLEDARRLRESVSDLPEGMQAFGQRRADQMTRESATQGLPGMSGLDPEYNGAFGEASRLGSERDQFEQAYQRRREAFQEYARQHQEDRANANAAIEALDQAHNKRILQYDQQIQRARIAGGEQTFASLADLSRGFAGEQSGIYQGLFATSKAFSVANSALAVFDAISSAMSLPFPANLAAAGTAAAQATSMLAGVNSVAMSVSGGGGLAGQAHDGIDSVPNTGTWNLEKGERVVDARMNKDLTRYLSQKTTNNRTTHEGTRSITVHAPVTVQGAANQTPEQARQQGAEIGRGIGQKVRSVIKDEQRPGGLLYQRS